jgi:cytosine/adenosine deaminase-related metal-dependent hydrolase
VLTLIYVMSSTQSIDKAHHIGINTNSVPGKHSVRKLLKDYGLLQLLPLSSDILLSHCNRPSPEESSIPSEYQIPIACTPEAKVQGSMGWPAAFLPGLNTTLGADCHFLNSSFVMHVARTALLMRRQETSLALHSDGLLLAKFKDRSEAAFNAATIHGAKAVGHGNTIGSIQEGKLADLVVFDTSNPDIACAAGIDPLTAVVRFSEVRDIEMVIIDGVIQKMGGELLPVMCNGQKFSWNEVRFSLMRSQKDIPARYRACSIEKSRDMAMNMLGLDPATLVGG